MFTLKAFAGFVVVLVTLNFLVVAASIYQITSGAEVYVAPFWREQIRVIAKVWEKNVLTATAEVK